MRKAKPEQKPSSRQRHRLQASNAESRIRLIVLLTAPKIFAISSITDKTLATVSQDCRLGGLIGWDTHTRNETLFEACLLTAVVYSERGVARRRPHRTPSLTKSTSDCAMLLRSRRTKRGDIMSECTLLCEC